mmetsp:Transcript_63756/g.132756  ORF Transcript_63756/g.132756 Transcript_63756/m.132756 type:complete len:367 (+) Transcript_63756:2939-4039(+)
MRCLMCSSRLGGAPSGSSPNACTMALNSRVLLFLSVHFELCASSIASTVAASVLTKASGSVWISTPDRSRADLSEFPFSKFRTAHCFKATTSGPMCSGSARSNDNASGCSNGNRSAARRSVATSEPKALSPSEASSVLSNSRNGSKAVAAHCPPESKKASNDFETPEAMSSSQKMPAPAWNNRASSCSAARASATATDAFPNAPWSLRPATNLSKADDMLLSTSRTACPEGGKSRAPSLPPKYVSTRYCAMSCCSSVPGFETPELEAPDTPPRLRFWILATSPLLLNGSLKVSGALLMTESMHRSTEIIVLGTGLASLLLSALVVCAALASFVADNSKKRTSPKRMSDANNSLEQNGSTRDKKCRA